MEAGTSSNSIFYEVLHSPSGGVGADSLQVRMLYVGRLHNGTQPQTQLL